MLNVAILDDYQNSALKMANWGKLSGKAKITVFNDHVHDREVLIKRLRKFQVICAMRERTPFTKEVLESLPDLKLLVTTGMRNASIDIKTASELGITVSGTEGLPYPTAELTWALILALARNITVEHQSVKEGIWQKEVGVGLKGKTLGIIGLGNLGSQVAIYGNAFGMEVIAWSQNLTSDLAKEKGAKYVSLDTLMSESDFVSIHTVLSPRTKGLIDGSKLKLMKKTSYLVNTSRGPIVDEHALIKILEDEAIAGAGLDVFDLEPMENNHPLILSDRTVITPHIGYVTRETYKIFYEQSLECVSEFLSGTPVRIINS
jgi:phosphoglycerate dehydrogenase-like enzyme